MVGRHGARGHAALNRSKTPNYRCRPVLCITVRADVYDFVFILLEDEVSDDVVATKKMRNATFTANATVANIRSRFRL